VNQTEYVRVVFQLPVDEDGWPPASKERLWATRVTADTARLDNVPFFVRGFASGDVVRIAADQNGILWAQEAVAFSGNRTIRVIPAEDDQPGAELHTVIAAFAPLRVDGEGIEQFGLVALNVPADAPIAKVKRLLIEGEADGRWEYEEGCVTSAWRAAA